MLAGVRVFYNLFFSYCALSLIHISRVLYHAKLMSNQQCSLSSCFKVLYIVNISE